MPGLQAGVVVVDHMCRWIVVAVSNIKRTCGCPKRTRHQWKGKMKHQNDKKRGDIRKQQSKNEGGRTWHRPLGTVGRAGASVRCVSPAGLMPSFVSDQNRRSEEEQSIHPSLLNGSPSLNTNLPVPSSTPSTQLPSKTPFGNVSVPLPWNDPFFIDPRKMVPSVYV